MGGGEGVVGCRPGWREEWGSGREEEGNKGGQHGGARGKVGDSKGTHPQIMSSNFLRIFFEFLKIRIYV